MKKIKLIVGLSNPGYKYHDTRHNAGSWYIKLLAKKNKKNLNKKFLFGHTATLDKISNYPIHIAILNTYMNNSGTAVKYLANHHNISADEILIVHDELDLPIGKAKIKFGGRNCGHNGLNNIQKKLNNSNFYRLRIGIGRPQNNKKISDFVLNKPNRKDKKLILNITKLAVYYTNILINEGILNYMNKLHTKT